MFFSFQEPLQCENVALAYSFRQQKITFWEKHIYISNDGGSHIHGCASAAA